MARTLEMFDKPRKRREWLMHVCDAASEGEGEQLVQYRCYRCGHESDWETAASVTAAKRGVPCPKCNLTPNVQIEGLADYKTWPEPRKFKKPQAVKERLSASPSRMQG